MAMTRQGLIPMPGVDDALPRINPVGGSQASNVASAVGLAASGGWEVLDCATHGRHPVGDLGSCGAGRRPASSVSLCSLRAAT